MPKLTIRAMQVNPGNFIHIQLDRLTRPARKGEINFADCGICEYEDHYWIGERAQAEGREVLQVTTLDALDRRNAEYPDFGDEDVEVVVGRNGPACQLRWFLLSKEELKKRITPH